MKKTNILYTKRSAEDILERGESSRRRLNSPTNEPQNTIESGTSDLVSSGHSSPDSSTSTIVPNVSDTNVLRPNSPTGTIVPSSSSASGNIVPNRSPSYSPDPLEVNPADVIVGNSRYRHTGLEMMPAHLSEPIPLDRNPSSNLAPNGQPYFYSSSHGTHHTREELLAAGVELRDSLNPSYASKRVAYLCDDFTPNPAKSWSHDERVDAADVLEARIDEYDQTKAWRIGPTRAYEGPDPVSPGDSAIGTPESEASIRTDSSNGYEHGGPLVPGSPGGPPNDGPGGSPGGPSNDGSGSSPSGPSNDGSGSSPSGTNDPFSANSLDYSGLGNYPNFSNSKLYLDYLDILDLNIIMDNLYLLSSPPIFHIFSLIYVLYKVRKDIIKTYGF
jgi:hypothetical protein